MLYRGVKCASIAAIMRDSIGGSVLRMRLLSQTSIASDLYLRIDSRAA